MAVEGGGRFDAPEEGAREAQLKADVDDIRSMSETMGLIADYSSVTAQLEGLSEGARKRIERHIAGEAEGPEEVLSRETPASPERNGGRPLKRKFVAYTLDADQESGVFSVHESFDEWNAKTSTYDKRTGQPTGIKVPERLQARISSEPGLKPQIETYCAAVRSDLDNPLLEKKKGLTLVYDRAEGDPSELQPKWYWYVGGQRYDGRDYADADDKPISIEWNEIPEEIRKMVASDPDHRKQKEYQKWLGPRLQGVRERIISAELAKKFAGMPERERTVSENVLPAIETKAASAAAEQPASLEGDAADIESVRNGINLVVNVFGTAGNTPDFTDIISSKEFRRLPVRTQQALLKEAGAAGSPAPSAPETVKTAKVAGVRSVAGEQRAKDEATSEKPRIRIAGGDAQKGEVVAAAAKADVAPAPVTRADVELDASAIKDFLRDTYLPTMAQGDEPLLEHRVRDGATKLLGELYRKQGREVPEGMIARVLSGVPEKRSGKAAGRQERKEKEIVTQSDLESRFRTAFMDAIRAARTPQDRALAVLDLLRTSRSGDPSVDGPAQAVLAEVQAGKFGGEGHEAFAHAVFLDAHGALPASRVVPEERGVTIAIDENYGLQDAVRAVVRDALDRIAIEKRVDSHDSFVERSAARLAEHVIKNGVSYLSLDASTGALVVADIDKFGDDMRSVYERLIRNA